MRIAVFGTGAVGGYFGGRLAQAGEEVVFLARGEHLRALQANGLRVESIKGDFLVQPVNATDKPAEVGVVDMILLAVKAWQVPEAAYTMRPMIGAHTGVVPLGNGVDAPGQLATELGAKHILGGLCTISAVVAAPGHIRHVGIEPGVVFGELDGQRSQRAEGLLGAFERAGVDVRLVDDIQAAMWEKFIFIAAFSGVGAVTRIPAAGLRSIPETRAMLQGALEEIASLGRARRVNLPQDIVAQKLAFIDGLAPAVTASMQRDIIDGRPSELEAQSGAVVRMGKEIGLPTPVHAFIYASLLPQESKARGKL